MFPGETIRSGADPKCCGVELKFQVIKSGGGWYIGTYCPNCGPYSRESGYYETKEKAQLALDTDTVSWRTANFNRAGVNTSTVSKR